MAGLYDTDIKLDEQGRLTAAANGDAPLASGFDCIMQDIRLEAMTQAGDLFYDQAWGWSLYDFMQSLDDELTMIEIQQRIKGKLEQRQEISPESIQVSPLLQDDILTIRVRFRFQQEGLERELAVAVSRVSVEVLEID